jgi:SAM-dependent methyltransferase
MDSRLAAWLDASSADVDSLWRSVLRREVEPEEHVTTLARLEAGMSRAALLQELATSPEFVRVRALDDSVAWAAAQRRAGARPRELHAAPGTDERPIEIPWVLARYAGERRVLDVGYAFAEPAYLAGLVELEVPELTGVDLASEEVPGLASVQADLRDLPFADGAFDVAFAISTLEHVGRDNSQYGLAAEHDDEALDAALSELRRVSRRLLVTVPGGAGELLPEQAVLAPDEWVERFEHAGFLVWEDELYELGDEGWRSVRELSPGLRYGQRGPGASAVLCAELRPRRISDRMRLAVRDRRYRDEPRRFTG